MGAASFVRNRDSSRYQINVTHHAGVVCLPASLALCNFLPQIRQSHIGTVALNQNLLSVVARASAFGARQANDLVRIFVELK
jgi:hypothetical protein